MKHSDFLKYLSGPLVLTAEAEVSAWTLDLMTGLRFSEDHQQA